jgi:predicted small secreted protein
MMNKIVALAIAAAFGLTAAGCNTIGGVGKDIARGGEKIEDASLKVRADWRAWRETTIANYDSLRARCSREAKRPARRAARMPAPNTGHELAEARAKYRRAEFRSQTERERMEDAYDAARDRCAAAARRGRRCLHRRRARTLSSCNRLA